MLLFFSDEFNKKWGKVAMVRVDNGHWRGDNEIFEMGGMSAQISHPKIENVAFFASAGHQSRLSLRCEKDNIFNIHPPIFTPQNHPNQGQSPRHIGLRPQQQYGQGFERLKLPNAQTVSPHPNCAKHLQTGSFLRAKPTKMNHPGGEPGWLPYKKNQSTTY